MNFLELIDSFFAWLPQNGHKIWITLLILTIYYAIDRFSKPRIEERADLGRFKSNEASNAIKTTRIVTGSVGFLFLVLVWGIDLTSMLVFASTAVTLLGVALFANWSLLSNITAYFVLLLHPSFSRGSFVRLIDGDNYIEGYISELSLFSTKLISENREVILYPNNLLLGRPALLNPRDRLSGVGKLPFAIDPLAPPPVDRLPK